LTPGLVTVHIIGLPLEVFRRASEHNDELLREFALIKEDGSEHVPARLLDLIDELRLRFGGFTEGPRSTIQQALDRGDAEVDIRYDVPEGIADGVQQLGVLFDEADAFCRSGDLLTLATLPESLAFRRWYLDEFVRQAAGQPPRPWSAFQESTPG